MAEVGEGFCLDGEAPDLTNMETEAIEQARQIPKKKWKESH